MFATYGHLPVLNSSLLAALVLGPVSNVSQSIDVLFSLDLQVFVDGDTFVIFKLESRISKERSRRLYAGSHDEERAFERLVVFEDDGADFAGIRIWTRENPLA
jgi:hypothetical protein